MLAIIVKYCVKDAYSEPRQTSKVEYFANIVNGLSLFTFFAERSILDVYQSFDYASVINIKTSKYFYFIKTFRLFLLRHTFF